MRNDLSSIAFLTLEKTLLEAIEQLQRNLNTELDRVAAEEKIEISSQQRASIRRLLTGAQTRLAAADRNHRASPLLVNFYRDINQFSRQVDLMETMMHEMLRNAQSVGSESEDESAELDAEGANSEPKSLKEFFESLSDEAKAKFYLNSLNLIDQINQVGRVSTAVYDGSIRLVDKKSENPIFLERFFDARRVVANVIEKIHYVIHPASSVASSDSDSDDSDDSRSPSSSASEEVCREFGLLSLCEQMEKQMKQLLKTNKKAQAKRIEMLKLISSLGNKKPESPSSSSDEDSSRESSCSSTASDSSSSSSRSSSGFFSRASSPDPRNPQQNQQAGARRQREM